MDALTAVATPHGLGLLNSTLKTTATRYALIGAITPDSTSPDTFYTADIQTSFYDSNGVLTFVVELPVAEDFNRTLHSIAILDGTDQIVVNTPTPKVALARGIGGMVTLKVAVTGEPGEVVFQANDYLTRGELQERFLRPATTEQRGMIRLATESEMQAATDTETAVVPAGLASIMAHLANTDIHWGGFRFRRFDSSSTYRPADEVKSMIVFVAGAGGHGGNDEPYGQETPVAGGTSQFYDGEDFNTATIQLRAGGGEGGDRWRAVRNDRFLNAFHGAGSGGDLNFYGKGAEGGSPSIGGGQGFSNIGNAMGKRGGDGGLTIKFIHPPAESYRVIVGAGSGTPHTAEHGHNGWVIVLEVL